MEGTIFRCKGQRKGECHNNGEGCGGRGITKAGKIVRRNNNIYEIVQSADWFNIVGSGYVKFLQMIVMPLVFILYKNESVKLEAEA
ncbi:hypothetical protein ELQ35_18145 [Peribacillus cavernae]|uniref:Uncharacterized protein n=1 Tax=Peribacillus cavernae TaxID=1674310 RepID=A0A3S1B210_9BACI|nr:hypothetical protein ELQ35_18145 [Peribacillus cavernae]